MENRCQREVNLLYVKMNTSSLKIMQCKLGTYS